MVNLPKLRNIAIMLAKSNICDTSPKKNLKNQWFKNPFKDVLTMVKTLEGLNDTKNCANSHEKIKTERYKQFTI